MQKNLLEILKWAFFLLLISFPLLFLLRILPIFFVLAVFYYPVYRLAILIAGFLAVSLLIIFIRRSRRRLWRYPAMMLAVGIVFYVSFLAIPEFNFLVTFNARQRIVNQYIQQGIKTENSWLGETAYLGSRIYFTVFKGGDRFGSRVFFVYTPGGAGSIYDPFDRNMTVKKLKKNWYFIEGGYAS